MPISYFIDKLSPKITTPIPTAISKVITDHKVPVIARSGFCFKAGNQSRAPIMYEAIRTRNIPELGLSTYLFKRYSPPAKKRPDKINQTNA